MRATMRVATALLLPAMALADAVAPIEVVFSDTIATETRDRLWARVREGLSEAGFDLGEESATQDKLAIAGMPAGCVVGPCLAAVGKVLGVKHVLVGRIEGVESSFDVTLTALETEKGAAVAQTTQRCDVCSMMDVEATVRKASVDLGTALKASIAPRPAPKPAPAVAAGTPGPKPPIWRGWKWVALGVGAVAVGTGTYLTQIDGQCIDDACTDQRDTGTPGMLSVGTGVVMMGAAGYLFLFRF